MRFRVLALLNAQLALVPAYKNNRNDDCGDLYARSGSLIFIDTVA